eukprot:2306048-Alexandrium_andersonii.AAC.1
MVQGQPDWGPIGPVREDSFHLSLAQGAQSQCVELPGNAEGHNCVPPAGQPGVAAVLVAAAGSQGQCLQTLQ